MYGTQIPPFYPVLGPAGASNPGWVTTGAQTWAGAKTFTDTLTINKTAEAGGLETIWTAKRSTDAVGLVSLENATSTPATFQGLFKYVAAGTNTAGYHIFQGTTDSGSQPIGAFRFRIGASTAVSTRPFFEFQKADGAAVLTGLPLNSGANLALSWGTQAAADPTFSTRSAGVRAIWYSAISGSQVDFATGVGGSNTSLYHSVPQATSTWSHRWFGGTTEILRLLGNAHFRTFGARTDFIRIATTTPVTFATATDHIVLTNMGTPSAVAVSLGNPVYAGQRVTIKDAKGDAAANNITITPSSGTIDGAATLVINTNYGKANLISDGTNWFTL